MTELNLKFLAISSAKEMHTKLDEPSVTLGEGRHVLKWLLRARPAVAHEVLCRFYDIACYQVSAVYPDMAGIPLEDADKWFVSTPLDSCLPACDVPLAPTEAAARELAVTCLKLDQLYLGNDVRISAEFNYWGATTGRVSSHAPSMTSASPQTA
jgi:hypothetical protein